MSQLSPNCLLLLTCITFHKSPVNNQLTVYLMVSEEFINKSNRSYKLIHKKIGYFFRSGSVELAFATLSTLSQNALAIHFGSEKMVIFSVVVATVVGAGVVVVEFPDSSDILKHCSVGKEDGTTPHGGISGY